MEPRIGRPSGGEYRNPRRLVQKRIYLERNVVVLSAAVFLFAFGEELWNSFLPKYMETWGASIAVIAVFGTFKDFLDALYQYPGGVISDQIGERRALMLFAGFAAVGYAVYLLAERPWVFFIGVLFVMAWGSLGLPALFSMIGAAVSAERRTWGFSWQSLLKRLPMVFAPALGGWMIVHWGMIRGVRSGLTLAVVIALLTLFLQKWFYVDHRMAPGAPVLRPQKVFQQLSPALKRLLISDIFARLAEGIAEIFIVLYAMNHLGLSAQQFGLLVGIQMAVAIAGYLPAAALAERFGRKPVVSFTFVCFALFPLLVLLAHNFLQMAGAFVVGGLREFGEPARKAMIVNLSEPKARGAHVGLYYLIRNLSVTPAAALGGFLWHLISPRATFETAFFCGIVGVLLFAVAVREPQPEVRYEMDHA
ncbi:MAG: MFS transporter [Acidobacteriia bacterium]|nr:MFS transporter [Terriglobia bacterium]